MRLFGTVYAHCDVPCGIYETDTMRHAADTCKVMVQKAAALGDLTDSEHHANFDRMVATKELHAERVKHELAVLWGDYFKPEHLADHPDLHDKVWHALKSASKVKQSMSAEACDDLIAKVGEIAEIFAATKR